MNMTDYLLLHLDTNYIIYPLVLFPLAIVFSVLQRYTDSDNPVGIINLFLTDNNVDTYRI
jgi:hypothetical protein